MLFKLSYHDWIWANNIQQSTISRIIKTRVSFLYTLLGAVEIWLSPEVIRTTMPSVFGKYSDTQVIVDSMTVRCQMPSSLLLQMKRKSEKELFRQSGSIPILD